MLFEVIADIARISTITAITHAHAEAVYDSLSIPIGPVTIATMAAMAASTMSAIYVPLLMRSTVFLFIMSLPVLHRSQLIRELRQLLK